MGQTRRLTLPPSLPLTPSQVVKLKAFDKFENTTEALAAATALVDSKLSKGASPPRLPPPSAPPAAAVPGRRRFSPAGPARRLSRRRPSLPPATDNPPRQPPPKSPTQKQTKSHPPPKQTKRPSPPAPPVTQSIITGLKKFLKKHAEGDSLAVLDAKLGGLIKEKLGIACVAR